MARQRRRRSGGIVSKPTQVLAALLVGLLSLMGAVAAMAQQYPTKPVRMVVGFPPGGGNDVIARLVAAKLQEAWGQPFIVENRPGANAIIATEAVAKAAPDGYTLLIGASGAMTFNPSLYATLPYDPVRDFAPVSMIGSFPLVLAVPPALPARSVQEFVQAARVAPGTFNYSSGSAPFQFAAELFKIQTRTEIHAVPYKGSAQAVTALLANEVHMTFVDSGAVVPHVQSGKLRALAVTSPRRSAALPDVPTMVESGLPDFDVVLWVSLFVPAGTPRPIVDRLQTQIAQIVQMKDVSERLAALGIEPVGGTPDHLAAAVKADLARWAAVAKSASIKAD
jgi:tripartite-type tricarboxylate transporter receptor subunit TctC